MYVGLPVLLGVTVAPPARADVSHKTPMGNGLRFGTVVGFTELGGDEVLALGAQVAVGHRIGRATLEAELDVLGLSEPINDYQRREGEMLRLGITARLDVARFGVGERSLWVLFVETGVGRQRSEWYRGEIADRTDTHVGMGWLLDHRGQRMRLLPAVGWHVGWRLIAARTDDAAQMSRALCSGKDCAAPSSNDDYDTGLLVSSGLQISW